MRHKKSKEFKQHSKEIITGKLDKHRSGFGFVIRDDGIKPDIYIRKEHQNTAMDNDHVEVELLSGQSTKPNGRIKKILKRNSSRVIGTYIVQKNWKGIVPLGSDAERINLIKSSLSSKVKTGDRVLVELDKMPEGKRYAAGRIIEILGKAGTYETEIRITLFRNNIRTEFKPGVQKEIKEIPENIKGLDAENREDLRHLDCFTIDPDSARDFDDAVSIQRTKTGYNLAVHIADVAHFVQEGSAIDTEAFKRGTSTYLVDRVIPMLPEAISNHICSLKPDEDRFAMTAFIEMDEKGEVIKTRFAESIIQSQRRFTYNEVDDILENRFYKDKKLYMDLKSMVELAMKLKKKRQLKGCVDFEFPEFKIELNKDGTVAEIKREERTISHRLIEEFMILTNEVVAEYMSKNKVPCLYRIHESPAGEKLEAFRNFIKMFGFTLPEEEKITSQHLQTILDRIRKSKEEVVISTMMLRSLKQAVYTDKNKGHFALASKYYAHFTSPIRRYPDLLVHRALKEMIRKGKLSENRKSRYEENMGKWGEQLSEKERSASRAEMESQELKTMEYIQHRVGEEFTGISSGVTSFGVFIELDMGLEGLIHIRNLKDDHYVFYEDKMVLKGERLGKEFTIGQEVRVKLDRVDLEKREVDFLTV
ncbi:MAG: ribonuclease R [Spirochaetes bacterium]|nr:ribonuclease R [Spirochaetota bacterium]